jgi:hypothetical protein
VRAFVRHHFPHVCFGALEPHIMQFNAIFGGGAADIAGKLHASIVIHVV